MKTWWASTHNGYSIVELLVIIVVIGILAAISIVSYNGIQNRAVASVAKSDLDVVKKNMEIAFTKGGGKYPNFISEDIKASDKITLRLVESKPYSGLSPVQSGVLFQQVCNQLVAEGYGYGANLGGGSDQYISGCNVWNHSSMQINGWHARTFPTPLSIDTIHNWYDANITNETWHPNKKQTFLSFADELSERYVALGGEFPVTHFYDTWSTPYSYQALPTPGTGYTPTEYCVEASHVTRTNLMWHVDESGKISDGSCS